MTPRRYRLTLGSLMLAVAVCAFILLPFTMTVRKWEHVRQERLRAVYEAKLARVLGRKTKAEALWTLHIARAQAGLASAETRSEGKLWAILSVNPPIVRQGEIETLEFEFDLINVTDREIDPQIPDSRIMVNGKELAESGLVLRQTPRTSRFQKLLPGEELHFVKSFRPDFGEPGVYRVVWEGAGFRAPEVVVRVLPNGRDEP